MLKNNRRHIEIPFQNVYYQEYISSQKWIGADPVDEDEEFDIPTEPPIEIATKLLTITIECKADILQIDEIKSKDTINSCFITIGNIEILSEIRNKRLVNTIQFEQVTSYKDFRSGLCLYKTVEVEIDKKDKSKISEGMRVRFILVETPKNLDFRGICGEKFNCLKRYQTLILKYDYKCLECRVDEQK